MRHIALILLAATSIAGAQTPLFQVLDNPVPQAAASIDAVGDVDGDGDADLVGPNGVFVNDGHARFAQAPGGSLAFQRSRATLVDVNGDGMNDLVSVFGGAVRIDLNLGGYAFAGPAGSLPPLTNVTNLAAGDVDGDGDADLVIATNALFLGYPVPGPVYLWINNGFASFTTAPPASFSPISSPAARIFLRDLDLDGDLDLVLGGTPFAQQQPVTLAYNNGAGVFTVGPSPWTGASTSIIELGEFGGDARPDLVVCSGFSAPSGPANGAIIILNSPGGFLGPVATVIPDGVTNFLAIDLDANGVDELLEQRLFGGGALRTVGAGGTVSLPTQSFPDLNLISAPGAETARDLDGDGDRDLVARIGAQPVELMNGGTGTFVMAGGRIGNLWIQSKQTTGDFDGDGDLDLAGFLTGFIAGVGATTTIVTGSKDGDGFFTAGPSTPFAQPSGASAFTLYPFDRDGDGDDDLFVARNVSYLFQPQFSDIVYDNTGGAFTQVATVPGGAGGVSACQITDFDGDGDQDILLARRGATGTPPTLNGISQPMQYLQNQGAAGFAAPIPLGANHATYDLDLGDFDGNGTVDVFQTNAAVASGSDPCVLYLNFGIGYVPVVQTGLSGFYTAAGDLNGDGLADLVIDSQVWFTAGFGSFAPGPPLPVVLVGAPELADVDGDGDLDLVETPATVLLNTGGAVFGPPQSYLPRTIVAPTSADIPKSAVFDVDRDGDLDIVAPGPVVLVNTTRQIAHGSIPRPGRPVSVDLFGTPAGAWFLWASHGIGSIAAPPWGTILLDPPTLVFISSGNFSGPATAIPGFATLAMTTPNNPTLVGTTVHCQAVEPTQMRLTNRISFTVMGY